MGFLTTGTAFNDKQFTKRAYTSGSAWANVRNHWGIYSNASSNMFLDLLEILLDVNSCISEVLFLGGTGSSEKANIIRQKERFAPFTNCKSITNLQVLGGNSFRRKFLKWSRRVRRLEKQIHNCTELEMAKQPLGMFNSYIFQISNIHSKLTIFEYEFRIVNTNCMAGIYQRTD